MRASTSVLPNVKLLLKEPTETQKDNARLRLKIAELEEKLSLVQKSEKEKEKFETIRKNNEELEAEVKFLKEKIQFYETVNQDIDQSGIGNSTVKHIQTLSTKLNEFMARNSMLSNNISILESQNAELELENAKLRKTNSDLLDENRLQKLQVIALSSDINRAQSKIQKLLSENEQLKQDFNIFAQKSSTFCNEQKEKYNDLSQNTSYQVQKLSQKCDNIQSKMKKFKTVHRKLLKTQIKAFKTLSSVIASLYGIDKQSIPTLEQVTNDETSISYFVGKVVTSVEKERKFYQTKMKHLEDELDRKRTNSFKKDIFIPEEVLYHTPLDDKLSIPQTV